MLFRKPDQIDEPLYAIVPVSNCWRWRSRWKHTERAIKHFMDSGAVVILIEVAFNRRAFAFADSGLDGTPVNCPILGSSYRHKYIGLRSPTELWLKENMINVAAQSLPYDWQQICWLDSDVHFLRPNWVGETIHQLQHYSVLQMFSHARDLGPNYEMLPEDYPHANGVSFVKSWQDGDLTQNLSWGQAQRLKQDRAAVAADLSKLEKDLTTLMQDEYYYGLGGKRRVFPGLAWAMTRKAWDDLGGLIDIAIWGGGDWHASHALVDKTDSMMHTGLHPNYKSIINEWHHRAQKHIRRNLGVLSGSIVHHWHGKKTVRGYGEKHRILANIHFDPLRHLKKDTQGLWQLHDDGGEGVLTLRDEMRRIATERSEDSTEL